MKQVESSSCRRGTKMFFSTILFLAFYSYPILFLRNDHLKVFVESELDQMAMEVQGGEGESNVVNSNVTQQKGKHNCPTMHRK
jgi:hypothetical protein